MTSTLQIITTIYNTRIKKHTTFIEKRSICARQWRPYSFQYLHHIRHKTRSEVSFLCHFKHYGIENTCKKLHILQWTIVQCKLHSDMLFFTACQSLMRINGWIVSFFCLIHALDRFMYFSGYSWSCYTESTALPMYPSKRKAWESASFLVTVAAITFTYFKVLFFIFHGRVYV